MTIIKSDVSDFFPICFMIPSLNYQTENDTNHIYERIINNESIKSFKQRLSETDWHEIEVSENPDEAYKTFLHKYLAVQYMREIEKWSHFYMKNEI